MCIRDRQQRVGIARALVVNPQIIFADEPTGNLDSKTTMEVLRLMQKIVREQDQTLVMVTHDNNLASYADRRIRIMDGRIVGIETGGREALYEGNAEDVYKRQTQWCMVPILKPCHGVRLTIPTSSQPSEAPHLRVWRLP